MRRVLISGIVAVVAFLLGVTSAAIWRSGPSRNITFTQSKECRPLYDASLVSAQISEYDDPELFRAFQENPLYLMPDCVDEAYSLTWIPAFHSSVFVRVWRSGEQAYMVAKVLDTPGWTTLGNIEETNARALTKFEWREVTELLMNANFWQLAESGVEIISQDGAVWLVDGLQSKQYHWVRRVVPREQYAEVCKHLIRLSGLETAHALYLP